MVEYAARPTDIGGNSTVGRRALGHPRRLRSTDRHGLLRQRQRREGDRGESPSITRPRDPPRTRGNPRAARGQFSLTVFQTGKPRRNFDRSWRGRGRRRRVHRVENAPTTPARRVHPAYRRVRVVSPRARRSRGAALRSVGPKRTRCQQRRGGVAVISRRFNLDPDRAPPASRLRSSSRSAGAPMSSFASSSPPSGPAC